MSTGSKIAVALISFVILLVGGALLYMYSGAYNVAATDEHAGLVRWALSTTQERSVRAHADDLDVALPTDSAAIRAGYTAYSEMCVMCHGAPGVERGWVGKGMRPEPPELDHAAEKFSGEEVFWIIKHGIKMAGMPALGPTHSDEEILELAAFVEQLPQMSAEAYRMMGEAQRADSSSGDGHDHTH